jgi:hypothetical protein
MLKVCVGHSSDPDSQEAITEVLTQCQQELQGILPQAGILVAATNFDHAEVLAQIQATFPGLPVIGATTNGEISSVLAFQEDSLSLMLLAGEGLEIGVGLGENVIQDPLAAVTAAIATAKEKLSVEPKLCITFPESMHVDGALLIESLGEQLGSVPIVGGTAADDLSFERTRQFFNERVLSNTVPILLIGGNIEFSYGLSSGWQTIGKKAVITKSEGVVVQEINDRPALEFYQEHLGSTNFFREYISYPLAAFTDNGEAFYVRAPVESDAASKSLVFTAHLPAGTVVQMAQSTREGVLQAAASSLEVAFAGYPGEAPQAALIISCAARRMLLGSQTEREYQIFQQLLPRPIPCLGFYSYGEISPFPKTQKSYFHNETFVTVLMGAS